MFRKKRAVRHLSAEELKTKLYSHFDKSGSLNRMRTELRGKLVSELLKVTAPVKTSATDEVFVDFEKALLPLQVTNWLVYDHLLKQGHQYALSIFVTEANLAPPEKLLTACDILCLFGLDSTTPEYKSITKMYSTDNERGCSYSLLLAVINSLFDFSNREERFTSAEPFDKELGDAHSKELPHKLSPKHILEKEQFLSSNLDPESLKFRKQSVSKEDLFCGRNISVESNVSERLQLVIEENKRENQSLRQKLLQELDRLHAQERSQQLEMEHERLQIRKERDVLLAEKEKLKEKDFLLIKEYENKLERKIRELETNFTSKMFAKEKLVEDLQRKLFEKEQRLAQIEVDFSSQQMSFNILKKELEDSQNMHKVIHEKYSALLNDNTNLLKKFESMSDYAVVKDELEAKCHQVSNLHKDIGDITKTSEKEKGALTEIVRNLEAKLNRKDSELMEAQRQLNLTRDTLHMKEAVWSKETRKLEQENLASKNMYRIFSQKLEEQKEDIQALHQTIHLLHYQLTEKNTKGSPPEPFTHQKAVSTVPKNVPEVFRISRHFKDSPPKYKESSLKFIEDAKHKIFKLQQQEDELQDKCSVIYSSVPEFNNQFLTNHLVFNATSTQPNAIITEPIKKYSPNLNDSFKNLIGNEMPTLDLSFPANIKNSLASTFPDIYTPQVIKTSEMVTNTEPTLDAPSVIFNSSQNKVVTSTGMLEHDIQLKNSESVRDKCSYSAQDTEDLVPKISNLKDPLVSNKAEYSNTNETALKNLISGTSIETAQTQMKTLNKFTLDSSSLEKESTAKIFSPVQSGIYKGDFQEKKVTFPDPKHDTLVSIGQNSENRNTSDSVPAFDSERLKPDLTKQPSEDLIQKFADDLSYDKENKSASKVTEDLASEMTKDSVPKDTSNSESVIDAPIVVDLDAVWKRKSSLLPVDSQPQHNILLKQQTSEQSTEHQTIPLVDLSETNIALSNSNSKELIHFSENEAGNQNVSDGLVRHESAIRIESSNQVQVDTEMENLKHDTDKKGLTSEFVNEGSSQFIEAESIKYLVSEVKNVHEDSLSELSEIHLSCGSEQEQQKEDSDNW